MVVFIDREVWHAIRHDAQRPLATFPLLIYLALVLKCFDAFWCIIFGFYWGVLAFGDYICRVVFVESCSTWSRYVDRACSSHEESSLKFPERSHGDHIRKDFPKSSASEVQLPFSLPQLVISQAVLTCWTQWTVTWLRLELKEIPDNITRLRLMTAAHKRVRLLETPISAWRSIPGWFRLLFGIGTSY